MLNTNTSRPIAEVEALRQHVSELEKSQLEYERMEKAVRESKFVLLVCTPTFAQKADDGVGGVGYEKEIVTGEIFAGEARETKFVPLLREGDAKESLPSYLKSRLLIDFREDGLFEAQLEELLRHFHGEPLYPLPAIGTKPDFYKQRRYG